MSEKFTSEATDKAMREGADQTESSLESLINTFDDKVSRGDVRPSTSEQLNPLLDAQEEVKKEHGNFGK